MTKMRHITVSPLLAFRKGIPMWAKVGQASRHVCLPEGWTQVKDGPVKAGDKFYNVDKKSWQVISEESVGAPFSVPFNVLIRKDEPQEVPQNAQEMVSGTAPEVGPGTGV